MRCISTARRWPAVIRLSSGTRLRITAASLLSWSTGKALKPCDHRAVVSWTCAGLGVLCWHPGSGVAGRVPRPHHLEEVLVLVAIDRKCLESHVLQEIPSAGFCAR